MRIFTKSQQNEIELVANLVSRLCAGRAEDFAASFEKRIMMLVVNSFILNSPIEIINGAWLQKLVESANASQFDQHTAELQSVFMMKTDAPQHRVKEVFLDYLISFRNRHNVHELAIEKLLINIRAALDQQVRNMT